LIAIDGAFTVNDREIVGSFQLTERPAGGIDLVVVNASVAFGESPGIELSD